MHRTAAAPIFRHLTLLCAADATPAILSAPRIPASEHVLRMSEFRQSDPSRHGNSPLPLPSVSLAGSMRRSRTPTTRASHLQPCSQHDCDVPSRLVGTGDVSGLSLAGVLDRSAGGLVAGRAARSGHRWRRAPRHGCRGLVVTAPCGRRVASRVVCRLATAGPDHAPRGARFFFPRRCAWPRANTNRGRRGRNHLAAGTGPISPNGSR